jgi:hypothetical protein
MANFRAERRVATSHPDSIHTVHSEMLDVFSMRVVAEMSVAPTISSPVVPLITRSPPHRARHVSPRGNHVLVCGLYV